VRSVAVLGASSEIATAIAQRLVADGARELFLAARDPSGLTTEADRLRALGAERVELAAFDARATETHEALAAEAAAALGRIDVVVLAFGVLGVRGGDPLPDRETAVEVLATNAVGAISLVLAMGRRLVDQGGDATLVVLSSAAAVRVRRTNPAYGASKAALDGFCRAVSGGLRRRGVRLVVVRPGFVRTRMTRNLRAAPLAIDAGDVAQAVARGLAGDAQVIWVPASMRLVAGIGRVLPRAVLDRLGI
jgi:decaprenylphospho-beta-D-erythro-pentofuranosid-2-ulose 2-reductase